MTDPLSPERLHVVFAASGAGQLKHWAHLSGVKFNNLLIFEPFAAPVGPVSLLFQPRQRTRWAAEWASGLEGLMALDSDETDNAGKRSRTDRGLVRQYARDWPGRTTIWYCSRHSSEMSLLSAFLGEGPEFLEADFMDAAEFAPHISGTGETAPDQIPALASLARKLDTHEADRFQQIGQRSQPDTARVRLFDNGVLVERPANCLDTGILAGMASGWQALPPLFASIRNRHNTDGWHGLDYHFLVWRFRELAQAGLIEWQGLGNDGLFDDNPVRGDVRRVD